MYGQVAKLTAADAAGYNYFGFIHGDRRWHRRNGAYGATTASSSGSVYVFRTSDGGASYVEVAKLTAADAADIRLLRLLRGHRRRHHRGRCPRRRRRRLRPGSAYGFRTTDGGATYVEVGC